MQFSNYTETSRFFYFRKSINQNSAFSRQKFGFKKIYVKKMSKKKHLNFLELLYKKKNVLCDFFFDEKDAHFFFFYNFWDVHVVQNRGLRLSKSLFRETHSIKKSLLNRVLSIKAINLLLSYT